MSTEGYQSPSRFDAAKVPHEWSGMAMMDHCLICGQTPSALIHRVLTHNPEADEAERLRVRETFNLHDHMKAAKAPISTPTASAAPSSEPVTVTLEQAIIIAKHYLLFDELERRAVDAETVATAAEKRATTAEAFAASALKELSSAQAEHAITLKELSMAKESLRSIEEFRKAQYANQEYWQELMALRKKHGFAVPGGNFSRTSTATEQERPE